MTNPRPHRNQALPTALWSICLALLLAIAPNALAMDEATRNAERERIRNEIAVAQQQIVDAYVAEQLPGPGRAEVLFVVGVLYEIGRLGDPDPVRATAYYEDAADMGHADALCALAHALDVGAKNGTEEIRRDPVRSRELFEEAAERGSVRAMTELGIMYADGRNIDPDSKKALEYFTEAAKWGDATALERLEPVMRKAREWEDAKPERKGKAGFPTNRDDIIDVAKVERAIDVEFNRQKLASAIYVELGKRLMTVMKKKMPPPKQ